MLTMRRHCRLVVVYVVPIYSLWRAVWFAFGKIVVPGICAGVRGFLGLVHSMLHSL